MGGGPGARRMTVFVRGRVQGVGFRWWVRAQALELGLSGHARNTSDGRVEVVAEGDEGALARLLARLEEDPSETPPAGPRGVGVGSPVGRPPWVQRLLRAVTGGRVLRGSRRTGAWTAT